MILDRHRRTYFFNVILGLMGEEFLHSLKNINFEFDLEVWFQSSHGKGIGKVKNSSLNLTAAHSITNGNERAGFQLRVILCKTDEVVDSVSVHSLGKELSFQLNLNFI